jgi:signal transduction histidine kinase
VRALADRVYPALLPARGLEDALHAAAAAAGIPFEVEAASLARFAPELEAAVYFCSVEAVANVAAHAGAGARVTVRAWREAGALTFEVGDDGAGFDVRTTAWGGGLLRMGDRLGALDGRLSVTSEPGGGTLVRGTIPLPP